ncbi:MAG: sigma-70 family RNA polymerase sigma factor [Leptospiraceae bacterium]|nr:sigma-70 family RNA polymerase sigma factor [Leptospiraceae bacterium]
MSMSIPGEHKDAIGATDVDELRELVRRCGHKDREALQDFFERFSRDIYNFPMKVFHLDEDAASDFYLYAFERLKDGGRFQSFEGRSSFRTWFYTVLRNLVIDWMRTVREIETIQVTRYDDSGNEYSLIENTADPRSVVSEVDENIIQHFHQALSTMPLELRSVFKLSYIFYLELSRAELQYVAERSGRAPEDVLRSVARLRHQLSEKELKNISAEDKITSLYLSVIDLKNRRDRLITRIATTDSEASLSADGSRQAELEQVERSIRKKYNQREKLLYKKHRGHFVVRTPYRYVAELLGIPEGSVSVLMMRANDRIRQAHKGDTNILR